MKVLGYFVYVIAFLLFFSFVWGARRSIRTGGSVQIQTLVTTMLFFVSLVLVPIIGLSPFHLLWMFPASMIIGMFTIAGPPFSFLIPFGNMMGKIACVGLDINKVNQNRIRRQNIAELMMSKKIFADEAKKELIEKNEW